MANKVSIRFYKDYQVRALWDEENNRWWFSVLDIVGAINMQIDHAKNRNYWKYLKSKLRKANSELVSATTQLKLTASDGKKYNTLPGEMKIIPKKIIKIINSIKLYGTA